MKLTRILFLVALYVSVNYSLTYSQTFYLYGDKSFGGNRDESDGDIVLLSNGDLIIGGCSLTNINGDKNIPNCDSMTSTNDLWIMKIDTAFNIIWQKDIGGSNHDGSAFISGTSFSNEILFSSASSSNISCDKSENNRHYPLQGRDHWIGKLNNNGVVQFEKTYGSSGNEQGSKIFQLSTGEILLAGSSDGPVSADKTVPSYGNWDSWVIKTDIQGNKIWDNVYGGSQQENVLNHEFDAIPLSGGAFLLGSTTWSPISGNISDSSRGFSDIWIIKVDNNGNKIWDKRFGGSGHEEIRHIEQTNDNGFILCGNTNSPQGGDVSEAGYGGTDFWIVKIDSMGNKMWDKRYGGNSGEMGTWVEQDFDGGYWVGGNTSSDSSSFDISEPTYGSSDYWIIKTDSLGNKLFDKRFGGPGYDIFWSMVQLADSSIMLFGDADTGISAIKTDFGNGRKDFWLVHFKYGNIPTSTPEVSGNNNSVTIFPNPANEVISFSTTNNFTVQYFMLYDVTGRMLFEKFVNNATNVDISGLTPALYFYEIRSTRGDKVYGKLLKQ